MKGIIAYYVYIRIFNKPIRGDSTPPFYPAVQIYTRACAKHDDKTAQAGRVAAVITQAKVSLEVLIPQPPS